MIENISNRLSSIDKVGNSSFFPAKNIYLHQSRVTLSIWWFFFRINRCNFTYRWYALSISFYWVFSH